jgi:hypothetical protein
MAKPVELIIEVKADTGDVAPGMQKLDKQLDQATKSAEKLDDALGDVSANDIDLDVNTQAIKAARDRIDDLRDEIANVKAVDINADTKQAEQEIRKLKSSIKALSDDAKAEPIDIGGGDIGHSVNAGLEEAGEGVKNFGEEANQTSREVAASFDGSIESIAGGFQELAANALGGFGPAGIVAGLGIAAGIGLGMKALQSIADEANEAKQEVIDLAAEIRDAGGSIDDLDWTSKLQEFGDVVVDNKSWWELWQKSAVTNLDKVRDIAEKTGVGVEDLFKGMAGDAPAAHRAIEELNEKIADQQEIVDNLADATGGLNSEQGQINATQRDALHTLEGYRGELEESVQTTLDAEQRNKDLAAAMGTTVEALQAQQEATEAAEQAKKDDAAAAEALKDAYAQMVADIADPASVYNELMTSNTTKMHETAQAAADDSDSMTDSWEDFAVGVTVSTQELINEWNRQAEAAKQFETNLGIIAAAGGQAMADEMRKAGPEVAGAIAETIATSDPAKQQEAFVAWGLASGKSSASGIGTGLEAPTSKTKVQGGINSLFSSLTTPPIPISFQAPRLPVAPAQGASGTGGSQRPQMAAAAGNVRVYIDGNQLRATVRTDVAAASARAALVGAGGTARP